MKAPSIQELLAAHGELQRAVAAANTAVAAATDARRKFMGMIDLARQAPDLDPSARNAMERLAAVFTPAPRSRRSHIPEVRT